MKIPIINKEYSDIQLWITNRTSDPKLQKKLVLVIVSTALLLDNMLYMVIVPIIPLYLRQIGAYDTKVGPIFYLDEQGERQVNETGGTDYIGEDEALGWLFASKAMVQIFINPISGTLIDRFGYEYPMVFGLSIMFISTSIFAFGSSYGVLFFARSLQGLGSAFADTSGLAMIADRFTEEHERSTALGIALAFISFGSLVAPPYGSILYSFAGKPVPFVMLALICLADAIAVILIIQPKIRSQETSEALQGTPIWRLFLDPYIAVCSGALVMANVSLAFLEPTISRWMEDTILGISEWEVGLIWLPAFFPHVAGVYATVVLMRKYPQYPWVLAAAGLAMEGASCFIVPFARSFWVLTIPLSIICFGIALIDTSLLPMLGYLVDTRHTPVYGSVYAIADISYSLAYALGPIIAGTVVANTSFFTLNIAICVSNLFYAPVITILRKVYVYKPFDNEMQTLNGADGGGGAGAEGYGQLGDDGGGGLCEKVTAGDTMGRNYGAMGTDGGTNATEAPGYGYGGNFDYDGGFGVKSGTFNPDYPQPEYPPGHKNY